MMRNLWFVVVLAVVALALGCGESTESTDNGSGDGGGAKANGKDGGTMVAAGGPEATAKAMLEGFKKGDYQAFLDGVDMEGLYPLMVAEEDRAEMTFEKFAEQFRQGMEQMGPPREGFDYKIGASKKEGDTVILSISIKEDAASDFETSEVPFTKINGKWMISAEGFMNMMGGE
jgi:hypothetical protein